jgi:hypothetical protein
MRNLVLCSWILLLCTACETGTQYDTNSSNKESGIVDRIDKDEIYDPTHSESYYIDQGEDDYAEEIASANRELADVVDRNIPEEIEAVEESVETTPQHFEGGTITDGLDIKSIRKAEHDSYIRLVFDSDGASKVGSYKVDYDPSTKRVSIVLGGYRAFSAKFPTFSGASIVEKIDFAKYLDDSGYKLYINLREITKIKVFALESPARLVIDVQKP